ncbi:MAG: BatA and WFA domain-containing protein [Planctomycetota bacterium]|nr:BatA and WFA domain-containing protein [Planctomycetota bacterium]
MFSSPLGLLALAGVPLVLVLHLFQRRFRRREVGALFLWGMTDTHSPSGRTRQRLVRSKSFWFEILAALALGLALGGPRAACTQTSGHLVVVLDSSASMGAISRDGTVDADARALVEDRIGDLGPSGRVTIVGSGPRPSLVAGPAVTRAEARSSLASWRPGHGRHDLGPAVALAREFAGAGAVLVLTDHFEPEAWPEEVELVSLGRPVGNLALVDASRLHVGLSDGTATERASVAIANLSGTARLARLSIVTADGPELELHRESLQLQPGARERVTFDLPPGSPAIEVRLDDDELAADNRAYLAPAADRSLALFSPLEPELRRSLGLTTKAAGAESPAPPPGTTASIDRWLSLTPNSYAASSAETADLVIAGATLGSARTWTLAIEAPGDARTELLGPFLKDLRDPALRGMTLEGIVWSFSLGYKPPGTRLISVSETPLLTRTEDGEQRTWHLSLDPKRSTLQRSPDWPILLANLAEERRAALPGPTRTNLRTGETLRYGAEAPGSYLLEGPGDFARELAGGQTLLVEMPDAPGLYTLSRMPAAPPGAASAEPPADPQPLPEPQVLVQLGVNLVDAAESDLSGCSIGERESTVAISQTDTSTAWLEALLAFLAVCLVLADGFVLGGHRLGRELTPRELAP